MSNPEPNLNRFYEFMDLQDIQNQNQNHEMLLLPALQ